MATAKLVIAPISATESPQKVPIEPDAVKVHIVNPKHAAPAAPLAAAFVPSSPMATSAGLAQTYALALAA